MIPYKSQYGVACEVEHFLYNLNLIGGHYNED